jgi:hypothetical protein
LTQIQIFVYVEKNFHTKGGFHFFFSKKKFFLITKHNKK